MFEKKTLRYTKGFDQVIENAQLKTFTRTKRDETKQLWMGIVGQDPVSKLPVSYQTYLCRPDEKEEDWEWRTGFIDEAIDTLGIDRSVFTYKTSSGAIVAKNIGWAKKQPELKVLTTGWSNNQFGLWLAQRELNKYKWDIRITNAPITETICHDDGSEEVIDTEGFNLTFQIMKHEEPKAKTPRKPRAKKATPKPEPTDKEAEAE